MNETILRQKLRWLVRANLIYGFVILNLYFLAGSEGEARSFATGWVFAMVNLELIKRIGILLFKVFHGYKSNPFLYILLTAKIAFLGMVISVLGKAEWLQAVPFVLGVLTILVSAFIFGIKEWIQERAQRGSLRIVERA